jgi:vacuolar iron transporter family protein
MKLKKGERDHKEHIEYKYLPEFVYGGIDGAITTFAIVAGVIGASLSSVIILILGFANLFADGFSMAASNYLSTKSQNEMKTSKKKPIKTASATFFSFLIIGFIPLISFILPLQNQFTLSIILTGIALLIVGGVRGQIVGKNTLKSSLQTLLIGGLAASIAFAIGYLIKSLVYVS